MIFGNKFLNEEFDIVDESVFKDIEHIDPSELNSLLSEAISEALIEEGLEEYGLLEESEEVVEEGVNADYHKEFKSAVKAYKSVLKQSKAYYKAKDYQAAKDKLKEARAELTKGANAIKKIPSDVSATIWGDILVVFKSVINAAIIYYSFIFGVKFSNAAGNIVAATTNSIPAGIFTANVGGAITGAGVGSKLGNELSKVLFTITSLIKDLKNPKKDKTDSLNLYKKSLLSSITVIKNQTINFEAAINYKMKKEKEKSKKDS